MWQRFHTHFAVEYLNLPCDGSVKDALPETDYEEDRKG